MASAQATAMSGDESIGLPGQPSPLSLPGGVDRHEHGHDAIAGTRIPDSTLAQQPRTCQANHPRMQHERNL